jgi:hypothetical protein
VECGVAPTHAVLPVIISDFVFGPSGNDWLFPRNNYPGHGLVVIIGPFCSVISEGQRTGLTVGGTHQ